jgi:hypothetical protein
MGATVNHDVCLTLCHWHQECLLYQSLLCLRLKQAILPEPNVQLQ